ncbi:hypothetical protein ACI1S4_06515 [Lactococcus petauri]|uniref:hypothetical protein n=1 Tax=Lactococcus petauri TaxID=1940789 RepID=UPI00255197F3|nr:hypothetical protein [Lactococcus petauri]
MKNVKKISSVVIILGAMFPLVACSNSSTNVQSSKTSSSESKKEEKSYKDLVKETQAKILEDAPKTYEGKPITDEMKDAYLVLHSEDPDKNMTMDEAADIIAKQYYSNNLDVTDYVLKAYYK